MISNFQQIKDIQLAPLTADEKAQIIKDAFGEITQITADNLDVFLITLKNVIEKYLIEYDRNWALFEASFQLKQKIASTVGKNDKTHAYLRLRNQAGEKQYAENFIRTLEKGNLLLEYIRFMLTGQIIETKFTLKGSKDEIYYVDKSQVDYKITLSTYGGSGNNFVSLAYSVDVKQTIADLQGGVRDAYKVTGTDIYARLMQVKDEYLRFLEARAEAQGRNVKYLPRYDSTDAEIFDLMRQRLEGGEIKSLNRALTMSTYRKMRATMGGRGGYRTSSTQLGDVGLRQDKLIGQKNNSVNFARQTLIRKRFQDLYTALIDINKNYAKIKDTFLKLFTEQKKSVIGDNISKMVNKEAQKIIRSLFK